MTDNYILKAVLIADTLAAPFDSLSHGHIKTYFREINSYTDTAAALKNSMHKWKKPGLYTFVSQLTVISAIMGGNRNFNAADLLNFIKNSPDIENYDFKFLRYPDYLTEIMCTSPDFFASPGTKKIKSDFLPLFTAVMSMFIPGNKLPAKDIFNFCISLTSDIEVVTYSLFFTFLTSMINETDPNDAVLQACSSTDDFFNTNQPFIFSSGFNPDGFITESGKLKSIMSDIISSPGKGEKTIIDNFNKTSKTPITRATIDNLCVIIQYAAAIVLNDTNPSAKTVINSVSLGGSVHAIAVYVSVLCALVSGNDIFAGEKNLTEDLINRRKILELMSKISDGKCGINCIREFIEDEIPLTKKALEEANAKVKKTKIKSPKKARTRETQDEKLSRHVVESWTKIDKARYKKEKTRQNSGDNNDYEN
ncbi:MAG: hypothetical protein JW982_16350 [Spirochaetes bacterium]|nr:hypothetical protein [Spirochaetota bacterium]